MKITKLNKVDLREQWTHEARDFTKWLSEPDNLELLSDEIGIGIELIQIEANVGRYNVDILAQEENTGRKIIIENQLEMTDHSHLGQLITYAAGHESEFIIWLVREAREEHQQAVAWLNEHTDDKINFFLVVVELWQIGNSDAAVKFSVVSRPNDWKKAVMGTVSDGEPSETKSMQLDFWQRFYEFAASQYPELKLRKPPARQWYNVALAVQIAMCLLLFCYAKTKSVANYTFQDQKNYSPNSISKRAQLRKNLGWKEKLTGKNCPKERPAEFTPSLHSMLTTIKLGSRRFNGLPRIVSSSKKLLEKIGLRRFKLFYLCSKSSNLHFAVTPSRTSNGRVIFTKACWA